MLYFILFVCIKKPTPGKPHTSDLLWFEHFIVISSEENGDKRPKASNQFIGSIIWAQQCHFYFDEWEYKCLSFHHLDMKILAATWKTNTPNSTQCYMHHVSLMQIPERQYYNFHSFYVDITSSKHESHPKRNMEKNQSKLSEKKKLTFFVFWIRSECPVVVCFQVFSSWLCLCF